MCGCVNGSFKDLKTSTTCPTYKGSGKDCPTCGGSGQVILANHRGESGQPNQLQRGESLGEPNTGASHG
ncbi:MAG: hypothetical protein HY973_00885 [Candidatus Kerfeldbacteria bacterium]|nr:hypothetical protein [Candidatus Kerfeldbacteria bacterium]